MFCYVEGFLIFLSQEIKEYYNCHSSTKLRNWPLRDLKGVERNHFDLMRVAGETESLTWFRISLMNNVSKSLLLTILGGIDAILGTAFTLLW